MDNPNCEYRVVQGHAASLGRVELIQMWKVPHGVTTTEIGRTELPSTTREALGRQITASNAGTVIYRSDPILPLYGLCRALQKPFQRPPVNSGGNNANQRAGLSDAN